MMERKARSRDAQVDGKMGAGENEAGGGDAERK